MPAAEFTLTDLERILREAAGAEERTDFHDAVLDTDFGSLGYESLALLETGGSIEREYGVTLDDDALTDTTTPRALIKVVNELLSASATS
ncbi:phosphopantetheine-binding protein [Streptomyces sp. NBC_00247]|uniref:phosphopantetheine-binding protein n=1 Tax=Streptomyces sp. NBC_00247 TaxID=2975689 RepID=UPI002E2CE177|nr:phosphopantetheine-binding protein [Streptomyces sp. NBC_00247]